jgi:hypothetical protein
MIVGAARTSSGRTHVHSAGQNQTKQWTRPDPEQDEPGRPQQRSRARYRNRATRRPVGHDLRAAGPRSSHDGRHSSRAAPAGSSRPRSPAAPSRQSRTSRTDPRGLALIPRARQAAGGQRAARRAPRRRVPHRARRAESSGSWTPAPRSRRRDDGTSALPLCGIGRPWPGHRLEQLVGTGLIRSTTSGRDEPRGIGQRRSARRLVADRRPWATQLRGRYRAPNGTATARENARGGAPA